MTPVMFSQFRHLYEAYKDETLDPGEAVIVLFLFVCGINAAVLPILMALLVCCYCCFTMKRGLSSAVALRTRRAGPDLSPTASAQHNFLASSSTNFATTEVMGTVHPIYGTIV
ncbi:uncharacterized protein LOC101862635 [Aplysia californica]|uniref:Uncharacterized protein LOC101862635 n=1 Tax=Aplysia californica TaxID=6500 RepID=A0ABM0ZW32_APLCA|nr:uncharacterized protein LOC101862635 [Aplysia californica]